jgi:Tfp pilus assembly protein PilV
MSGVRRGGARTRRGLTLVEVIVALVVLEVGFLAVVGTLTLAGRLVTRAELLHAASQDAAALADSLVRAGASGSGERLTARARVSWSPGSMVVLDPVGAILFEWRYPAPAAPAD